MNGFFRRILLSVWLTILLAALMTHFLGKFLPISFDESKGADRALVAAVARELRDSGATPEAAEAVANRFNLTIENRLQIYIIDRTLGRDIEGRSLPSSVQHLVNQEAGRAGPLSIRDDRLITYTEALPKYLVVGFLQGQPRFMFGPRERYILFILMILVSAALSYALARFIVLPIRHLREAGQRVAAGDLTVRVAHTVGDRQDDIARLARDFDAMTQRIESLLRGQQRLMRDVSHELRSPLARLQALQSLARQRFTGEDTTHILDRMDNEAERLNRLIEEILSFARLDAMQEIQRQNTDLVDLLSTVVDDALIEIEETRKTIEFKGPERLVMQVDASLLHSAIENVVRNALRFTADRTAVTVSLAQAQSVTRIVIEDEGPGVPQESLDRLFEPFYQIDESRTPGQLGSGVGLAIAKRSVELHQGRITAENRAHGGLRVVIELPAG